MNKENEKMNKIELEAIKSKLSNEFGKNLNTLANVCKSENIERIVDTFINSDFLIQSLVQEAKKAEFILKIELTNHLNETYNTLNSPCIYKSEYDKLIAEKIKEQSMIKYGIHCDISDYENHGELFVVLTFCFHNLIIK